jgi:hypothetical protein
MQDERAPFSVLRGALPKPEIDRIRDAAAAFYAVAEAKDRPPFPRAYLYNPGNMAVGMAALDDYGTADYLLLRIVANSPAADGLRRFLGDDVLCSLANAKVLPAKRSRPSPAFDRGVACGRRSQCRIFQRLRSLGAVHSVQQRISRPGIHGIG